MKFLGPLSDKRTEVYKQLHKQRHGLWPLWLILLIQSLLVCLLPLPLREAINNISDIDRVIPMVLACAGIAALILATLVLSARSPSSSSCEFQVPSKQTTSRRIAKSNQ